MNQFIEVFRRRKWLFIIPFAVVFLVPVLWSFLFMRSYEANSLVWLDSDLSVAAVLGDDAVARTAERPIQQEADTLQQLLQSRSFVTAVIAKTPLRTKMDTPRSRARTIAFIRKRLGVDVVGPNALKITFYGRSPKEAVVITGVTTNQFLDWIKRAARNQNKESIGFFTERSHVYRGELESARKELMEFREEHPESRQLDIADKVLQAPEITASPKVQREFQRLTSQATYAQELYDSSLTDLAKTRVLSAAKEEMYVNGLRVVDTPVAPTTFSKKRLLLFDFLALMAAIIIGGMAVVLAELTDRTLRSGQAAEGLLDLQVLTEVPQQGSHGAREA